MLTATIEYIAQPDKFQAELNALTWAILTYWHMVPGAGN